MITKTEQTQIEYGDFQTPPDLAKRVCQKLLELGVSPDTVIEPTCGIGAFVEAAANAFPNAKIIGVEINPVYLEILEQRRAQFDISGRVELRRGNFFELDWNTFETKGKLLVLGNFPWVTNSQQGMIGGDNLPRKKNFHSNGLDAITGKSNFDISEWMLLQTARWLKQRPAYLAMLCKTSVARKFLNHLYLEKIGVARAAIYRIDAKREFDVSVEACLLFCEFDAHLQNYDYDVLKNFDNKTSYRVGHRQGMIVRDLETFGRLNQYYGHSNLKWRSGIKHDCAKVMELQKTGDGLVNGLGEQVDLEPAFLYPLLKGSAIANNRVAETNRYLLVTQKFVGEQTRSIQHRAPKTWAYLEAHANDLDRRKSRIYQDNPRFSIFGVGPYTFEPFKIALCGLYKKLDFRLIRPLGDKPAVFDDTVYFLGFENEEQAKQVLDFLMSPAAQDFLSSLIFWDEKRPIKSSVLNSLDLQRFENVKTPRLF